MLKKFIIILLFLSLFCCTKTKENSHLTIYTYDSFSWIQNSLIPHFEKTHNCTIKLVLFDSTSGILTRLKLEKDNPQADIAIGITPTMLAQSKKDNLFEKYKSPQLSEITNTELIFDNEHYTTPYDYGALAVLYNTDKIKKVPASFNEFFSYKKSLLIQDPRTSSTGTDFLLWTIALHKNDWKKFWFNFKGSVLTATAGWSESFAKFESGEAPMMISYATDNAYSIHNYGSSVYDLAIPGGKAFLQIEGASVVKGSSQTGLAGKFIDFMLSDMFQKEIPLNQWMFPVIKTELPEVFSHALTPEETVSIPLSDIENNLDQWLMDWEKIMAAD